MILKSIIPKTKTGRGDQRKVILTRFQERLVHQQQLKAWKVSLSHNSLE